MKKEAFIACIIAILFAMFALTGCGGGSSAVIDEDSEPVDVPNAETVITQDEMENTDKAAMNALFWELEKDGTLGKLSERGFYFAQIDDDGKTWTNITYTTVEAEESTELLSNELKPEYDKGAVIVLISPNATAVNTLLEALGEEANFSIEESDNLEIYAIVRVPDSDEKSYLFTYQIPSRQKVIYNESDIDIIPAPETESPDNGKELDSDSFEEYSGITEEEMKQLETDFQVQRWRDFFHWAAFVIDEKVQETKAAQVKVRNERPSLLSAVTTDELTSLMAGFHPYLHRNYCITYKPFNVNEGRYDRTITRDTKIVYDVYSCHSFTSGSDYYLVKATMTSTPDFKVTNPQRYYKSDNSIYTHYLAGFTHYLINSAYIEGAESDDTPGVLVIKNVPGDTVPKSRTITEGMNWTTGGKIGINAGGNGMQGALGSITMELSNSVSHTQSITYTTTDWSIENLCTVSIPKFRAIFDKETNNGDPHYHRYSIFGDLDEWQDIKINNANKNRIEFTTEWVWEVKKEFWQNRDEVKIISAPVIGERFAYGWGKLSKNFSTPKVDGQAVTIDTPLTKGDLGVPAPAHLYVSKGSFNAKPEGETLTFNLLCNSNWTVESDSYWCIIGDTSKSGSDTGDNEKQIIFNVAAYPEAGGNFATRSAIITVTEIRPNGRTGNIFKIEVQQASK